MKRIEPNLLRDVLESIDFTYHPADKYTGQPIFIYNADSNITIDPESYKINYASYTGGEFSLIIRDMRSFGFIEDFIRVLAEPDI